MKTIHCVHPCTVHSRAPPCTAQAFFAFGPPNGRLFFHRISIFAFFLVFRFGPSFHISYRLEKQPSPQPWPSPKPQHGHPQGRYPFAEPGNVTIVHNQSISLWPPPPSPPPAAGNPPWTAVSVHVRSASFFSDRSGVSSFCHIPPHVLKHISVLLRPPILLIPPSRLFYLSSCLSSCPSSCSSIFSILPPSSRRH